MTFIYTLDIKNPVSCMETGFLFSYTYLLVGQLRTNEFAVQASDVADRDTLWTFGFASTSVCTVTEAQFVHLSQHSLSTASSFYLTLWQQCQLAYLSRSNNIAEPFLQAAAQAPQPIHAAASIASSATGFGIGMALASGIPPVFTDT